MHHYKTSLPDEAATIALGHALAAHLSTGLVIYLHGDLGAGKTALTRAILRGLGHQGTVKSPTYTLAEPYELPWQGRTLKVMHFDLYRMLSPDEFIEAGFRDEFNPHTVCIVEWPEKAEGLLPEPDITIHLDILDDGRAVKLRALSDQGQACLAPLQLSPDLSTHA